MKELGSVAAASLRIVFFETSKRIAHRIEMLEGDAWQPVLVSCEGIDQEPWPASPPLQSLHIERHGVDDIAFLVGMAGRSHWSASIRANQSLDRIEFEIACRVNITPDWLGSTYELPEAMPRSSSPPPQIHVANPLVLASDHDKKWTLSVPLAAGATPRTIAWNYVVLAPRPHPP